MMWKRTDKQTGQDITMTVVLTIMCIMEAMTNIFAGDNDGA